MDGRRRAENDYSTAPNTGLYDELRFYDNPAFNSLDIAPFTANSSVYKNRPPKPQHVQNTRGRRFEPVSFAGQTDVKASRSSSRRMRWLVALNVLLLFLTIICLALTSFLYYKVIPKGDDGDGGNGCDSGSRRAEGFATVMPRVEWRNLVQNVEKLTTNFSNVRNLKNNVSLLQEAIVGLNSERKLLFESVKMISENLTKMKEEIKRTQEHVLHNKQAIASLNLTYLKKDDLLELWRVLNLTENELLDIRKQVINMSKIVPPRGPPGYNGTQGPVGSPGPVGPRGLPGPGNNLTLCKFTTTSDNGRISDTYAKSSVTVTEQKGTRIISVHCDSNDAKIVQLTSSVDASTKRQKYKCACEGTLSSGDNYMYCYIHYWKCPTAT